MRRPRVRVSDRNALTQFVRAAQRDDAQALDALLRLVRPSFARFFGCREPRDVAEDLTQTALIRTMRVVGRMQPERAPQHLTTIARALLADEHLRRRREKRRCAPAELAAQMEWPVDLEREAEYDELARAVHRAGVRALRPELLALLPAVLGERTLDEVAQATGVDTATVRRRLTRVRTILRRELEAYAP